MENRKPIVGISCGDLNGIGLEVVIKTFQENMMLDFCTPVLFASSKVTSYHRKAIGVQDFSFNIINDLNEVNQKRANLFNLWNDSIPISLGNPSEETGKRALESIDAACDALLSGKIDLLVTAPINKNTIKIENGHFSGHTDYLAEKLGGSPLMILYAEDLRVALVTGHIPIKEVASALNQETILNKLKILNKSLLQDFGIRKPRIAVLGLNPHAGDDGLLGDEEKTIITPAIEEATKQNIMAYGPYAADGFFGSNQHKKFDAILAMYHDQGLTPFKALTFENGVNYTAGLNFIRTSPDHGTGYAIAGKNEASPNSFRNAVFEALELFKNRKENIKLAKGALKPQPMEKQKMGKVR
jgi:4-hydroxythreonine-4-phosphate dehydrogenase